MTNIKIRCIAKNCPYNETCFLYNIQSLIVYDYSCTCDKNSGFENYIPVNKGDENNNESI